MTIIAMTDRTKAIQLVRAWLNKQNTDPLAFDELVIDEKLTIEKEMFFGIYYRALKDENKSPGLLIVDRQTRKLYNTVGSSWYNWIKEFETYKATGYSEIEWGRSEIIEREVKRMQLPQTSYAFIKEHVKHEERETKLKEMLQRVADTIKANGLKIAGNPVVNKSNKNEFSAVIEVRIPFEGKASDDIQHYILSAMNIYCIEYTGNYYDFVGALHELKRYGRMNGCKEKGEPWIEYLEYDLRQMSDTWKNRICIPIE